MSVAHIGDRGNQEATVWVGGLEPQATEELVWELMLQAGPVVRVNIPRDKITNTHQGYAFCEFRSPEDAEYAIRIMNMVKLFGKPLKINKAAKDKRDQEVGANLFVGNLDPEADEKMLYDTFSAFGCVLSAKVMVDPSSGEPRGFGFVNFDSFEAADAALSAMQGQYLCNKPMHVSFAYKKDGTKGERHGSAAERLLAAQRSVSTRFEKPNATFAAQPGQVLAPTGAPQMLPPSGVLLNPMVGAPVGVPPPFALQSAPPLPPMAMMQPY